jgi:hypothetical protein
MIRYVADPSEERLMKSTLASGKPPLSPVSTMTGGTGKVLQVPAGNITP